MEVATRCIKKRVGLLFPFSLTDQVITIKWNVNDPLPNGSKAKLCYDQIKKKKNLAECKLFELRKCPVPHGISSTLIS